MYDEQRVQRKKSESNIITLCHKAHAKSGKFSGLCFDATPNA